MAFEVKDYMDLVRLLTEHPEWRSELRRLLLSDELLALPEMIRELAEAQRRTEEQLGALAEAQRRTEERLDQLTSTVHLLAEQVRSLVEAQQRTNDTVGDLKGRLLEVTYREKAGGYFGALLRRLRVVAPHTLEDALETHLSHEEFKDVLLLDLLVCGQLRGRAETPETWLAVEISSVVDQGDVERARRRAALLRRAGYRTIPVVAGERATLGAEDEARQHQVAMLQDGGVFLWEEALAAWVPQPNDEP